MPIIVANDLVKEFVRPVRFSGPFAGARNMITRKTVTTRAVDGISLSVEPGELVGYLGPNGAGKSTTVKMLTGVLVPTSGSLEVNGVVPWKSRTNNARSIGAVFGQRTQLWIDLPLSDSFDVLARLYGLDWRRYQNLLMEFVELLDMAEFIETPVRSLSLGQRMRGDLVASMLHEPPILYLDEPTVGLDVVAKERIREFVTYRNREKGTTIMLTTHDVGDIERLCRRVVLIDRGVVLYDGSLAELRRRYVPYRELVARAAAPPRSWDVGGLLLHEPPHRNGLKATYRFDPSVLSTPAAIAQLTRSVDIVDVSVTEPGLEDIIRNIYLTGKVADA